MSAHVKLKLGNALVSVSDKSGLIDFLKPLAEAGLRIVSTGGTKKYLDENKISTVDVSAVTQFPEVLDGRVKTLHPRVHMGLLADLSQPGHVQTLADHQVESFSIVVGNLYAFEAYRDIDHIDIGGPSFLRASAKNHAHVVVVCDPSDYSWVQKKLMNNEMTLQDRKKLALKVFQLTSYYDGLIAKQFASDLGLDPMDNQVCAVPMRKKQSLRYGENAHQSAVWYEDPFSNEGLNRAQILQGKELSYNNLLDLHAAARLACEFSNPVCVAVKHNNPCGVGFAESVEGAVKNCFEADPKSIFGGIIAVNTELTLDAARFLSEIFLECIVAPSFSVEAKTYFEKKKNLRLLTWNFKASKGGELKSIDGGFLYQQADQFLQDRNFILNDTTAMTWPNHMRLAAERGSIICGYLKSNAIAIVDSHRTFGLGMGQVNRVDAVKHAIERSQATGATKDKPDKLQNLVLVSDAFFPFADSIELIANAGIKWIVQPGGSVKDNEVIAAAQKYQINMIMTGVRHFRH